MLLALGLAATTPVARAVAPDPSSLLLTLADLPAGYVADAALENADATARSNTYSALIVASAFAGYRTERAGIVHYVARLRQRSDVALLLGQEGSAVDHAHAAARITLSGHYGDATTLAYQQRGDHGEEWALLLFGDGSYVTALGVYNGAGEQASIDLLQQLAPVAAARLRAARQQPRPARTAPPRAGPSLRITALTTTTRRGRPIDTFRPHSAVYWRAVWHAGTLSKGARETLRAWVWHGKTLLYSNALTDRPFSGDNAVTDHLQLHGAAPGSYKLTITVTIGRLSARGSHTFQVIAASRRG